MDASREIVLVAAMGRNRVIGDDGGMPWHLPADLRHFKETTMGRPVIMGRRTWESIGKPLPGRANIVLTRSRPDLPDGVEAADSLDAALEMAGDGSVFVIGGGQVYAEALPRARRMELTMVDLAPDGDTRFPAWRDVDWRVSRMRARPSDDRNPARMVFCRLERVPAPEAEHDD
ncbi:MAG: dihydrofolate reductase [Wenzhouxiangellaceae bacterium]|nr:dihydrofolate reductase [Wenzhouxiangellaceae bacterium]